MTGHPKVLVLTQSVFGGNYGGILQAYALQKAISELGYEVKTQSTPPNDNFKETIAANTKNLVKRLLNAAGDKGYELAPPPKIKRRITADQLSFVEKHIQLERTYPSPVSLDEYDCFVVGSDQVWRAAYSDLEANFLSFTTGREVKRVAYAASFGRNDLLGYSPDQIQRYGTLLRSFDAVSVRETSGVDLCKHHFDTVAMHVADPTLLFDDSHYSTLISQQGAASDENSVFTYVLDRNPSKQEIADRVGRSLRISVTDFRPADYSSGRTYRQNPDKYHNPRIEDWLGAIHRSSFVVTDSFHGTVFAIIFNKPFVSIGNAQRGMTRFTSLLEPLGLSDRLISHDSNALNSLIAEPINWDQVNMSLSSWRKESRAFLANALRAV